MVAYTTWWLVSAEPVNFGTDNAKGWGVPRGLVGLDAKWITDKANAKVSGKGYLYVIADTAHMDNKKPVYDGFSRRRGTVPTLYVAQVSYNNGNPQMAIASVKSGKVTWLTEG